MLVRGGALRRGVEEDVAAGLGEPEWYRQVG